MGRTSRDDMAYAGYDSAGKKMIRERQLVDFRKTDDDFYATVKEKDKKQREKKKEIQHRKINNSVTKHNKKRQFFVSCIYILLFAFILLYYKYNIKQYISLHTIRAHTYPTMMSFFSYFLRCQTNMIDGVWVLKEKELKDGPFPFPFLRR